MHIVCTVIIQFGVASLKGQAVGSEQKNTWLCRRAFSCPILCGVTFLPCSANMYIYIFIYTYNLMLHIKYLYAHWVPLGEYPKLYHTMYLQNIKAVKLGQYRGAMILGNKLLGFFPSFSLWLIDFPHSNSNFSLGFFPSKMPPSGYLMFKVSGANSTWSNRSSVYEVVSRLNYGGFECPEWNSKRVQTWEIRTIVTHHLTVFPICMLMVFLCVFFLWNCQPINPSILVSKHPMVLPQDIN